MTRWDLRRRPVCFAFLDFGAGSIRTVVGVGGRHLGANAGPPLVKFPVQGRGLVGHGFRQVVLFGEIVLEVVQLDVVVLVELDELEIALADRAVGRRAAGMVVRIVPVDRVAFQRPGLLEQWHEAFAVQRLLRIIA